MENVLPLFNPQIAAKSVDPATSHAAAEQAEGLAARHHKIIVRYLESIHPFASHYREIADKTQLERHAVGRRLKELERAGLVERKGTTRMDNGRKATLWAAK